MTDSRRVDTQHEGCQAAGLTGRRDVNQLGHVARRLCMWDKDIAGLWAALKDASSDRVRDRQRDATW